MSTSQSSSADPLLPFGDALEPLLQAAGIGLWTWDLAHDKSAYSPLFEHIIGTPPGPEDTPLKIRRQLTHPDDAEPVETALLSCLNGAEKTAHISFRIIRPDKRIVWISEYLAVLNTDARGHPKILYGMVRDISDEQQQLFRKDQDAEVLRAKAKSVEQRLETARQMSAAMFEGNPHVNLLFDDHFQIMDCNPAAVSFFGFSSKQELMDNFIPLINQAIPSYQLDGRKSRSLIFWLKEAVKKGVCEFETDLFIRGRHMPVSVVFKKIPQGDSFGIVAYAVDLTSLKEARNELIYQDRLLRSVNKSASLLTSADPEQFAQAVWESMRIIGRTAEADRMYIWQNFEKNGKLRFRQTFEWTENALPQQGKDFAISLDYDDYPYWRDALYAGKTINAVVADLPAPERSILEPRDVLSILVIPIFINGAFWGFIGFDDCHAARTYAAAEEKILESGANTLVSAILRNEMTCDLIKAQSALLERDRLLQAVNSAASLLMEDHEESAHDVVLQALEILGKSVDADRAYIWQNSEVSDRLCCSQVCEWAGATPSPHEDIPAVLIPYDEFIPNWRELMAHGRINARVSDLDTFLINFPGMENVVSILVLPIFLQSEFWGFIGFDDLRNDRVFTTAQEDILESGGMLIAEAILRREMTQKLVEAREEALSSVKAKGEFLSRMSHEIRTPMNAIIGMTAIARKTKDVEKIQHCLDRVDTSSRQLLGIINDVLDMSKIESGKLEIISHEFDFEKMTQDVFSVIQVRLDEKHQEFQFDFNAIFTRQMIGDELRLSQVLINLLTNAVKFTPEYGKIVLKVREIPQNDGVSLLHVEVIDNGIGIAKDRQSHLFQSFEQADGSITRQFGGTGLGLAISKKIVNLMGGKIWVESETGAGSIFAFEVPVTWGENRLDDLAPKILSKNLRILVVDDAPDVLEYFGNILGSFALSCDTAESGRQAIETVTQARNEGCPYDVTFIDWNMPGLNGGETAREIKRVMSDNIIVIMISVFDWSEIEPRARDFGISYFLPKPVLPSALYNTLVQATHNTFVTQKTEASGKPKEWHGKQILLVEDIEINREIVASILEETDISIDMACDGKQAVDRFRDNPGKYDMILMDVQMPVLDGLGATRQIRALPIARAATIPILAMTANAFKEDEKACLDAGMNGHLAKPISVDELLSKMDFYLDVKV